MSYVHRGIATLFGPNREAGCPYLRGDWHFDQEVHLAS